MPLAVYILGLSIFAQGTSELMLSGLLTEISSDLGVSVPRAGLLISAFAVGMLIGAPILAVVTQRWSRRNALLAFLAVFVVAHVVAGLASDYRVLLGTRVIAAFVYAGFWAVAASTAVDLAGPAARGRAMGIVAGGLTLATVIGLPAGTFLGQHFGWRAAFWAVAALSVVAMAGVAVKVPGARPGAVPQFRKELRALANGPVLRLYGTIALSTGATLATFGYLGALLTGATRLPAGWVPVFLALYGLGSLGGIAVGGRTADLHPMRTLVVGYTGLSMTSALLALAAHEAVAVGVLVFLLGAFGFGTNPTLNSRVFALAPAASTLGAAGNVVSFNIGITVGPWLGGLAIGAGMGYPSVAWIGAALGILALGVVIWSQLSQRRSVDATASASRNPVPVDA